MTAGYIKITRLYCLSTSHTTPELKVLSQIVANWSDSGFEHRTTSTREYNAITEFLFYIHEFQGHTYQRNNPLVKHIPKRSNLTLRS